jgi:putative hemolysin
MMTDGRRWSRVPLGAAAAMLALSACGGTDAPSAPRTAGSEDERGAIGVPPPPDEYCKNLGFALEESDCVFEDGTRCDQWAFYRGECGQERSYCATRGGTISTRTEEMDGWTSVYAVCTLDGKECREAEHMQKETCE